jgi:8-oxo-dGTP diphosphatase
MIHEYGSITQAAAVMNMSYRHAWGIIQHIQESVGDKILITTRGGSKGGGARLTNLGKKLLEQYESFEREIENVLKYGPKPYLTVDGVIFDDEYLVLIRRGNPPFKGKLALPGGFVEHNETTEEAVVREIYEELGIKTKIKQLIGVYSEPGRDPRHHTISVVYELEPESRKYKAGSDAAGFERIPWKNLKKKELEDFAFDHGTIIFEVINRKKSI